MSYLTIQNEMQAVDNKKRNFYDLIPAEEVKDFSAYVMMRWTASVESSAPIQEYYLRSANIANLNLWDLNKHPKLQWLCLSAISPKIGTQRHYWLAAKKKEKTDKKEVSAKKFLMELYPTWKEDDIDLLASQMTKEELNALLKDHGQGK